MMKLTADQIEFFKLQGYLPLPEFFSAAETDAIRNEVQRLKMAGLLRNVTTDGDGKTHSSIQQNLQMCPMSPQSPFFRALPFHPLVVQSVSSLIGDPVVLHLDQVFLKPGRQGAGTSWHQDNAYFKIADPLKGTAMWIAVHESNIANGTLEVIPGMQNVLLDHSRDPYSDHHIRCYPPEESAVPIELPASGVVFFSYGTPHCTRANNTDTERAGAAFHFFNAAFMPETLKSDPKPSMKNPYLTGPLADGGISDYSQDLRITWLK